MDRITNDESKEIKQFLSDLFSREDITILAISEKLSILAKGNTSTGWVVATHDGVRKLNISVIIYDQKLDKTEELNGKEYVDLPEYRTRGYKIDIEREEAGGWI